MQEEDCSNVLLLSGDGSKWEVMLDTLLQRGTNILVFNNDGLSPLHLAAREGLARYAPAVLAPLDGRNMTICPCTFELPIADRDLILQKA